jgi:hypothetical protein
LVTPVTETTGAPWSSLTITPALAVKPAPSVAEHVKVTPAVFAVSVVEAQPIEEAIPETAWVSLHVTLTLLRYQPLLPRVPVICGAITGGVVSIMNVWDGRGVSTLPAWSTLPNWIVWTPLPKTVNGVL